MRSAISDRCSAHRRRALLVMSIPVALSAAAQDYPAKPVRNVLPFPAGGSIDRVSRIVAQRLTETIGQNVIVENRATWQKVSKQTGLQLD